MNYNMKLDVFQNQLKLENSRAEENRKTETKVKEDIKSDTKLQKETDGIPNVAKADCRKEVPSEAVEDKLANKLADEMKTCSREDNGIRKPFNVGECKVFDENKNNVLQTAKTEETLTNGLATVKEQMKHEEISNRPKLDDIFPNSVIEGSEVDIISPNPQIIEEETAKSASPVPPYKKAKVEISRPGSKDPTPSSLISNIDATTPIVTDSDLKTSPVSKSPPLPATDVKDLGAKTESNAKNTPKVAIKKENNSNGVDAKIQKPSTPLGSKKTTRGDNKIQNPSTPSCSKNQDDSSVQEKKVNKQRPIATPKSPVGQKVPPKETMMAGGECFVSVDGIVQETRNNIATTPRRISATGQHRSREADATRTTVSKHFKKLRNEKNWKKKHLFIAGGIGFAMVCFYAYYRHKA